MCVGQRTFGSRCAECAAVSTREVCGRSCNGSRRPSKRLVSVDVHSLGQRQECKDKPRDAHGLADASGHVSPKLQGTWRLSHSGTDFFRFHLARSLIAAMSDDQSVTTSEVPQDDSSGDFISNILTPGSSLNPAFLTIVDGVLATLLLIFLGLLILTRGSVHFIFLMLVTGCLWASVKWCVALCGAFNCRYSP